MCVKIICKKIGDNIRTKRKELGLTQETLAMKVVPKLDRSKISDMENGKEDFLFLRYYAFVLLLMLMWKILLSDMKDE